MGVCPCIHRTPLLTQRYNEVIASPSLLLLSLLFYPTRFYYSSDRNRTEYFCEKPHCIKLENLPAVTLKITGDQKHLGMTTNTDKDC